MIFIHGLHPWLFMLDPFGIKRRVEFPNGQKLCNDSLGSFLSWEPFPNQIHRLFAGVDFPFQLGGFDRAEDLSEDGTRLIAEFDEIIAVDQGRGAQRMRVGGVELFSIALSTS